MKQWIYKDKNEFEPIQGIHKNVQHILRNRGIHEAAEMIEFLSDSPTLTYDPFLLKDMKAAVELIRRYVEERRKICVYGDYDVDGVTAVCLLTEFLENITHNVIWYIPSRHEEGYGLNKNAMTTIKESGVELIITVDCGISAYDEVEYAKSLGMQVIVTDHHTVGEKIADCLVINPKQEDCGYPFADLCGCGVAYKLCQALQKSLHLPKSTIIRGLDLVAIATIADIVPLLDENRTIVKFGLNKINAGKRPGLRGLIRETGISERSVTAEQIAFIIGPHINAGGRIDSADAAMQLLREKDSHKIRELSEKLVYNNNVRKELQREGYEEAKNALGENPQEGILLVAEKQIHEGIAGIVAGKLKEEFYRPVLIVTDSKEDILKGTGRSIPGLDLYQFLGMQEHLLLAFGGHKAACGFSLKKENLEPFKQGLQEQMEQIRKTEPEIFQEKLIIEQVLKIEDLTIEFVNTIKRLEPFGFGNVKPIFACEDLYVVNPQFLGRQKEHVKFLGRDKHGREIECIMFGGAGLFRDSNLKGSIVDVAGVVNMNVRTGSYTVQFILEDMRRR